jgi:hypothetical protein
MSKMTIENLPQAIEVYEIGSRRLYAKTRGGNFALFEDELTPEELIAIARDIAARRPEPGPDLSLVPLIVHQERRDVASCR